MIAPTIVGFTSIALSLSTGRFKNQYLGLSIAFLPVFLFLALRFNYGNDYPAYLELFNDIAAQTKLNYQSGDWHAEIGWVFLNRMFAEFGFFLMIALLALTNCYFYVRFILKFVPKQYYWISIFLYIFIPDNMLVQASAMRQTVSIGIFIFSLEFLIERRWFAYAASIAVATLFHTSALILFPIYLIGSQRILIKKWVFAFCIVLFLLLSFFSEQLFSIFFSQSIDLGMLNRYLLYEQKGELNSGFGFLIFFINLIILLLYHDRQNNQMKVIFRISIIGIYVLVLAVSLAMLARISYYFSVMAIVTIPSILKSIRDNNLKLVYLLSQGIYFAYMYSNFFLSPIYGPGFGSYTSIFSIL